MSEPETRDLTGACLCGSIRFMARGVKPDISACHCGMCRRWVGGPFLAAFCSAMDFEGEGRPVVTQSSDWAERASCGRCGSPIFWRLTTGKYAGVTSVPLGVLDDQTGFTLEREWFIDRKPDAYTLAGTRECITEADALAMLE